MSFIRISKHSPTTPISVVPWSVDENKNNFNNGMNIRVKQEGTYVLGQPWNGEVLDSSSFKIISTFGLKRMLLYKWGNNKSIASSIWLTLVAFSTMRRPSTNEAETLRSVTTYQSLVSAPNLEKPSASPWDVKSQYGLENRSRGLYVLTRILFLLLYSFVPSLHKMNTWICP